MIVSSKELLIEAAGIYDVRAYERVKRLSMRIAKEMERAMLEHVDGRVAMPGEGCDGVTRLGRWEFAMGHNTKNGAGDAHDTARCPDRCVQILGRPRPGWMSGERFLELHGYPTGTLETLVSSVLEQIEEDDNQMRLPV